MAKSSDLDRKASIEEDANPSFIPPHATTAEQMLLGILMLESESWDEMNSSLKPQDFYDPRHRCIYAAIHNLIEQNKSVDAITVIEDLTISKQLDKAGGKDYLAELAQNADTARGSYIYGDIIRDRSLRRQLLAAAQRIIREVHEGGNIKLQDLVNRAEHHIFKLTDHEGSRQDMKLVKSLVDQALKDIDFFFNNQGKLLGQGSGFTELDKMTAGLQATDFIVVAGRPSMGKTSFALNLAAQAAVVDKNATVIFSMEMDSAKLLMRLIAMLGHVHLGRLRDGELKDYDWRKIRQAATMLSGTPIYLDD